MTFMGNIAPTSKYTPMYIGITLFCISLGQLINSTESLFMKFTKVYQPADSAVQNIQENILWAFKADGLRTSCTLVLFIYN